MKIPQMIFYIFLIFNQILSLEISQELCSVPGFESHFICGKMRSMSPEDIEAIEDFFRSFFVNEPFAYTLFGSKPIATGIISMDSNQPAERRLLAVRELKGWHAWKKYPDFFPSKNFCFKQFTLSHAPESIGIILINKKQCLDVISKFLPIFQSCFGIQKLPEDILKLICFSDFPNPENKKNGFLICLGLLYGFGEKNSQAFERRELLIQHFYQAPFRFDSINERMKKRYGYFLTGLQKINLPLNLDFSPTIQSVIEELNTLEQTYQPLLLIDKSSLCPIANIGCIGFSNDPATHALQFEYETVYQKLVDIYNSEHFLELIITQLAL